MKKRRLLIVLGVALAALLILAHLAFRIGIAQLKIREALEVELSREFERDVRVSDIRLGPFLNVIEIRGVKVAAGKDLSTGPLFEVSKLRLHLDLSQLLRRILLIRRITLVNPRLWAEFDAQGESPVLDFFAILTSPPKRPRPVQLEIAQVKVSSGNLYYRDARLPLDGEAQKVEASLDFHPLHGLKGGSLEVGEAKFRYRNTPRNLKNLKTSWRREEGDIILSSLEARLDGSSISLKGKVASFYQSPTLDLQALSSLDLATISPWIPSQGTLRVEAVIKGPIERPEVRGSTRMGQGSVGRLEVRRLAGDFRWSQGQLEISEFSAQTLAGNVQGKALLDLGKEIPKYQASIVASDLDLPRTLALSEKAKDLPLKGKLDARLDLRGAGWNWQALEGRGWARGHGLTLPGSPSKGRLEALFRLSSGTVTVEKLSLIAPPTEVVARGKVAGEDLNLSLEARAVDLQTLAVFHGLANLQGQLKFKANLTGKIRDPRFSGDLEVRDLRFKGMGLDLLRGPVRLEDRRLALSRLVLWQGNTAAWLAGSIQLPAKDVKGASLWRDSTLGLSLKVAAGRAKDVVSFLGWNLPIEGALGLEANLGGTLSRPRGQGRLSLAQTTLWGEPWSSGEASLSLEGERLLVERLVLRRGNERIEGRAKMAFSGDYSLELSTSPLDLARIKALGGSRWSGQGRLSVTGQGNIHRPQLQGQVAFMGLSYRGLPLGNGDGAFSLKNEELRIEASLPEGGYRLQGSLKTQSPQPYRLEAVAQNADLTPLLSAIDHPFFEGARGKAQGNIEFSGALQGSEGPRGKGRFSSVELTLWGETLQNDGTLAFSLEDGHFRFDSFRLKGEERKARVQGSLYPGKEWDFSLDGELGLSLLQGFFPIIQGGMGRAQVSLTVKGPWKQPELKGLIRVRDGSLQFRGLAVPLEALSGSLTFEKDGANLTFMEARLGGGRFTAWGKSKKTGKGTRYDLDFKLEGAEAAEVIKGKGVKEGTVSGRLNTSGKLMALGEEEAELWNSLEGEVSVEMLEGRIKRYTLLAKIFSLLNVAQVLELKLPDLFSEGMSYKSWKGDFRIQGGVAETENFFLDSDSMKINTVGKIDLARGHLDLMVGVQPLQTIDKVISSIPILGYILTGKEKSLISAYFEVKGDWDDPEVKPIPLKSLGRGILGIFRRFLEIPERLISPGK